MSSGNGLSTDAELDRSLPLSGSKSLGRTYAIYVAIVIVATIVAKYWLAQSAPYSQGLSDDYDYMYKSLCFLQGDWKLTAYSFKKIYTGPAYPLIISPWVLFSHPRSKMLCIYTIHFLLSAGVVALGTALVTRFSRRRSLLVPIVLATYAPTFLLNYYAMTENVFFLLLIAAMWLCVDFNATCRHRGRLALLLAICALFPLVRSPGYAIVPVIWALLIVNRRALGWRRASIIALAVVVCALGPEQFFYQVMYGGHRLGSYAHSLSRKFEKSSGESAWRPYLYFALSSATQLGYAFVTTGIWMVPALFATAILYRRLPKGNTRSEWRNLLVYAAVMALILTAFTEVHMSARAQMDPGRANFIIGRYADPAAIVLGLAGLCALMSIRRCGWIMQLCLVFIVPLTLYAALRAFDNRVYHPMHDIGLAALALHKLRQYPDAYFWTPIGVVLAVGLISRYWKVATRVMLVLVIGFNLLTLRNGFTYISKWSLLIAKTMESAEWTVDELPVSAKIVCDKNIRFTSPPPGLPGWKWRNLYNIYMAYVLMVYPRHVEYVKISADPKSPIEESFGDAEYMLSVYQSVRAVNWGFPIAWHNEDYVIYDLDPNRRRVVHPVPLSSFELSRKSMRDDNRIVMAWHNCTAALQNPVHLKAGQYRLSILARAEGCSDLPPILIVELADHRPVKIQLVPGTTQNYFVPLNLPEDADVTIKLTNVEKPRCPHMQDKNIFIRSILFERAQTARSDNPPPTP